jgi:hypothetical protein
MNDIVLKNKNDYNMETEAGRKNLLEYIDNYNKNIDENDPLSRKIGIDEAFAICNIEGYIKSKSSIIEIVREALEIGFTCKNFKSNNVFTFARQKLKKLNLNSIIRMQVENYINFRMQQTEKSIKNPSFENVTTFTLNGETFYYNVLTGKELEGEQLKAYKEYISAPQELDALPF